jgi:hypothetical protein
MYLVDKRIWNRSLNHGRFVRQNIETDADYANHHQEISAPIP